MDAAGAQPVGAGDSGNAVGERGEGAQAMTHIIILLAFVGIVFVVGWLHDAIHQRKVAMDSNLTQDKS